MEVVQIVTFYTWLLEVCYLCAMTLSCLVSLVMLMRSMILHRSNLKGLYKGDVYSIYNSQKTIRPSKPGIVCWMGLTGYQAAIVCLGMVIQTVVFFICFLFLVFLIIIPVFYGRNIIAFEIAGKSWPGWVTLILVTALQHVTAKFAFIKKDAGTRDLNNRESLFLLTYLLFLINIMMGLSSSPNCRVLRPSLPILRPLPEGGGQPVTPGDEGFLWLLLDMMVEGGRAGQKIRDAEEGIQVNMPNKATSRRRIQCRWQLVYTLVNNPSLLGSRKHFQTLKTSEITLNGTPNRSSSKGSMKEAATPAAEPVQSTEAPTNQDKAE
ncbi:hypothetical protein CesoFtcFv8_001330 [Champsocephalus esox]|uniref:Receptor for retinol uptake STRA6 n=1 Tax=Champsocephalus esox TaxID=159716 RepID=A0AAN8D818_9TELE|nr:hypothetical protein CesoFtcFv8_001330 [Champsocephalus esox]